MTPANSVIELEDGQLITVPTQALNGITVGDPYTCLVLPEAEAALDQAALARTLLNQLITDVPPPLSSTQDREIGAEKEKSAPGATAEQA